MASDSSNATDIRLTILTVCVLVALAWSGAARAGTPANAANGLDGREAWAPLSAIYGDRILADASLAAQEPGTAPAEPAPGAPGTEAAPSYGAKPFLYSILLPGLGQLSMGEKGHAIPFFIAEGLIWTSYVYWKVAGDLREDDYIEQAQLNAGIGVSEADDDYWSVVGQYTSSSGEGPNSYEEDLRRDARDIYPSDPAAQDAYVAEKLPTGDQAWEWRTEELRSQYKDTRESANSANHRAKYSFAAALLNRVVSVIDVQLLRKRHRNEAEARELKPETRIYADALEGGGRLVVQRRF